MSQTGPRAGSNGHQSEHEERQLVSGLIAGDRDAVASFLLRTHHPVYCMAGRLTSDPDQRRDWSHEVLLGILEDLTRGRFVYTRPGSFWAWFRKRAYYRLLDEYRRGRRRRDREHATTPEGEGFELDALPGGEDPTVELERTEILAAIESCLVKLPNAQQQQALWLLLFQEMDYQSIADALEAPLNTIKAWIRRGRLAVRRCLVDALNLAPEDLDA